MRTAAPGFAVRLPLVLALAILCGCNTPGTWSFPLTSAMRKADEGEIFVATIMLGPFLLLVPAIDVALLPVTVPHDLWFLETDPPAAAEPVVAAPAPPGIRGR